MTLRAYIIGYEPPGVDMDEVDEQWIEDRIRECDFCFTVTNGRALRVGDCITEEVTFLPDGSREPGSGRTYKVVGLEHFGKVAVVRPMRGN